MGKFSKKSVSIVAAVIAVAASSAGAFAYWTAGGSGSGSAATGTNVAITAVQTTTVSAMAPGVAPQPLSGTFLNSNAGPVYVSTVTASVASVAKDVGAVGGTCDATDYTITNPVMTINAEALADDTSTWAGASIAFKNKVIDNQDQCKLAIVTVSYAIV